MQVTTLGLGSYGPEVAAVLMVLREHGYWDRQFGPHPLFTEDVEDAVEYWQSTHLGPDGEPLVVDGWIGDKTRWSFENPDGDAQRSFFEVGEFPSGISEERLSLLTAALKYHGAEEQPNGSNRGPVIDKFLPDYWLSRHDDSDKGPPWCAFFVAALCRETFSNYPLGGHYGSTRRMWREAKRRDMSCESPTPGDAFMLRNPGGSGHTGFVYWVSSDATHYYTIEGNCGNRVKVGRRSIRASNHAGFINLVKDQCPGFQCGELGRVKDLGGSVSATR